MNKLNNKGFSLVEVLAVVVILGILAVIMVPVVNNVINQNKEDNYNSLKDSILSAARTYISDNRYNIELDGTVCSDVNKTRGLSKVGSVTISNDRLIIYTFRDYLSNSRVKNPKSDGTLKLDSSYVIVKYDCNTLNYNFELKDEYLIWE